jgi:hypothetical protein
MVASIWLSVLFVSIMHGQTNIKIISQSFDIQLTFSLFSRAGSAVIYRNGQYSIQVVVRNLVVISIKKQAITMCKYSDKQNMCGDGVIAPDILKGGTTASALATSFETKKTSCVLHG